MLDDAGVLSSCLLARALLYLDGEKTAAASVVR